MKYSELTDSAKAKARDWYRESTGQDEWWENTYEDARVCSSCLGIEIDMRIKHNVGADISFSSFYTQGSGCSFNGTFWFGIAEHAVTKTKAYASQDEELHHLATLAEALYARWTSIAVAERVVGNNYLKTSSIPIVGKTRGYWSNQVNVDNLEEQEMVLEDDCNTLVSGFASWIYKRLQQEYEYQTSDTACEEGITANDYDFNEDGTIA